MALWSFARGIAIISSFLITATNLQNLAPGPIFDTMGSRKAPFRGCDPEEPFHIKEGAYAIYLFPGHSFEDHSRAVGRDLTPYVVYVFDDLFPEQIVYSCEDVGNELLEEIRKDSGVEWVDCDLEPVIPST